MILTPQQVDAIYEVVNENVPPEHADQVDVELREAEPNPFGIVWLRINEEATHYKINRIGEVEPHVGPQREESPSG